MTLTDRQLGTLPPGEYQHKNGLVLRVRQSGARSWALRYSLRGKSRRFTLGKVKIKDTDKGLTLKQAGIAALEVLARVARGEDPQAQKVAARHAPETITVSMLGDEAMAHLKLKPKSRVEYQRLLDVEIRPAFGDLEASALTRREVRVWSEKLAKRAPYVANRAYQVLRRFYSLGVERDLIPASPFVGLKKPSKEKPSERVLSLDELWALLRSLDGMRTSGADVVRLLLLTGVRRQMVLGARADEFELGPDPRWIIPAERTKSGRDHVVPLTRQALQVIRPRLSGTYLFPAGSSNQGVKAKSRTKVWRSQFVGFLQKRMDKLLGKPAPRWTIHNLRHTIRTHMREHLGVSDDVAELILGHKRPGVSGVYNRAELMKERRAALEKLAGWLEQLPDPRKKLLRFKEQA